MQTHLILHPLESIHAMRKMPHVLYEQYRHFSPAWTTAASAHKTVIMHACIVVVVVLSLCLFMVRFAQRGVLLEEMWEHPALRQLYHTYQPIVPPVYP